jgi:hypothetical protein
LAGRLPSRLLQHTAIKWEDTLLGITIALLPPLPNGPIRVRRWWGHTGTTHKEPIQQRGSNGKLKLMPKLNIVTAYRPYTLLH